MRRFFSILAFLMPMALFAQTTGYTQFESIYLKPDTKHLKELYAALKSHNQKFHASGPYHATVYFIANGEMTGWLVWEMGPCTFAESDARPASAEHDNDWDFNVLPYVVDQKYSEIWRRDDDLSVLKPDQAPAKNYYIRYLNVNRDQQHRVNDMLKKISATNKELNQDYSWSVYDNMFRQGEAGRHMCFVTPFNKWAELDEDVDFSAAYDKLYGENAFNGLVSEWLEVFTNSWDEIWTVIPELSAGN